MRELALSRGFYPVVAIDMSSQKEKDMEIPVVEKEKELERITPCQVPVTLFLGGVDAVTQHPQTSTQSKPTGKSTASGSTAQHGPRSKRY